MQGLAEIMYTCLQYDFFCQARGIQWSVVRVEHALEKLSRKLRDLEPQARFWHKTAWIVPLLSLPL